MKNGGIGFGGHVDVCMCECIHEHAEGRRKAQCYGKYFFGISNSPLII